MSVDRRIFIKQSASVGLLGLTGANLQMDEPINLEKNAVFYFRAIQ